MENWVLKRSRLSPEHIGLVYGQETWTFRQLAEASLAMATTIDALANGSVKRLAVIGDNSANFYLLLLACHHLGAEVVVLNNRLSEKEIYQQIQLSEPELVVYEDGYQDKVLAVEVPHWPLSRVLIREQRTFAAVKQVEPEQVATIMFTSGTTGVPKGVKQTFGNHLASAMGSALNLGMLPKDKWLLTVPLYHISGYSMLNKGLIYGNTVYLVDKFEPEAVAKLIQSAQVTHLSLVPTMLVGLLAQPDFLNCPSLSCLLLGGAPLSDSVLTTCYEQHLPVVQSFGMTETASQVLALRIGDAKSKIGSSGQPLWPVEVKIGQAEEGIGEILIKGPNVSPGYLNGDMAKTVDGFFLTGDLGYIDSEGFVYVVGRRKELIISGGENIYPQVVENALLQLDGIAEVAVIGEPDEYWGERVVAYVVTESNRTLCRADLIRQLTPQLAPFKQPKTYYQVEKLPRNSLGKLQKQQLETLTILAKIE